MVRYDNDEELLCVFDEKKVNEEGERERERERWASIGDEEPVQLEILMD